MKMGLYARVSTHDQQTLALQQEAMVAYARQRGGSIVMTVEEVGSGVSERLKRDALMRAARRRDLDVVVVWRLDRWGRSLADLVNTLQELQQLGNEASGMDAHQRSPLVRMKYGHSLPQASASLLLPGG